MDSPIVDIKIGHITSQWAESNRMMVTYSPQIDSTNNLAKVEAFSEELIDEPLCLYLTDHQTHGRGRGTHSWTDPRPGSSLLSSWSFQPAGQPQPTASALVGLAVYRACMATWPFLPWNLKAPNDIFIGDKKVAGLLIENIAQGSEVRLIIGLGMNITSIPENMDTATSLIKALSPQAPLLGDDYMAFLDRLMLELTDAVFHCDEPLNTTARAALLTALNQHPLLIEKYSEVEADGSLIRGGTKISWMNL